MLTVEQFRKYLIMLKQERKTKLPFNLLKCVEHWKNYTQKAPYSYTKHYETPVALSLSLCPTFILLPANSIRQNTGHLNNTLTQQQRLYYTLIFRFNNLFYPQPLRSFQYLFIVLLSILYCVISIFFSLSVPSIKRLSSFAKEALIEAHYEAREIIPQGFASKFFSISLLLVLEQSSKLLHQQISSRFRRRSYRKPDFLCSVIKIASLLLSLLLLLSSCFLPRTFVLPYLVNSSQSYSAVCMRVCAS